MRKETEANRSFHYSFAIESHKINKSIILQITAVGKFHRQKTALQNWLRNQLINCIKNQKIFPLSKILFANLPLFLPNTYQGDPMFEK